VTLYPPLFFIAQAVGVDVSGRLVEYGILGICVLVLGVVVGVLFKRLDQDRTYHRDRADRYGEEIKSLNTAFRDQYAATLAKATEAISDLIAVNKGR
jgi:uncharacterized membrane-anchored protein YhcB (DUF1043 family)